MSFLTPVAALAALAASLPFGVAMHSRGRAAAAARTLGLEPPQRWRMSWRTVVATAAVVLLGLAAGQPVLSDQSVLRTRTNVAVLFVLDTSRSMAASLSPTSPTRLTRAKQVAVQLRAAIPNVPAGVATLTDRVLPDLLPVPDIDGFDDVIERGVAIEEPPPVTQAVNATSYAALDQIATGNYFTKRTTRRVIVLLTDGESNPFDAAQVAHRINPKAGYRFLAIRFWNQNEAVFDPGGQREPGYHPNPIGRLLLAQLAAALGGRSFQEDRGDGPPVSYLRQIVGTGPVGRTRELPGQRALAPYVAALATLLLIVVVAPSMVRACRLAVRRRMEAA